MFCILLPIGVFNTQGTCRRLDMSCFLECGQSQKLLLRCPIQCKGNLKNQRHTKAHPSSSQHAEGMLVVKTWPRGGKDSLPSVTSPPGNRLNGHTSCNCQAGYDAHSGAEMLRVSIENPLLCRFKLDNVISYSVFIVTFVITLPKVS